MKILGIPSNEYKKRRDNLLRKLPDRSIVIFLSNINSQSNLTPYRQDSNFIYMTGFKLDKSSLLLIKNGKFTKSILATEENDPKLELWIGKRPDFNDIKRDYLFDDVVPNTKFKEMLYFYLRHSDNLYFYFPNEDIKTLGQECVLAKELKDKFPYVSINSVSKYISSLRRTKSKNEIDLMKKAISITNKGIRNAIKHIKPGVYEYQVQAALEYGFRHNNSKNNAFISIIASGINSTTLHYSENNSKIPENSVILFDVGSEYNYYASDISRTFPTSGKFNKKQKNIYKAVLETQKAVIDKIKPGKTLKELNEFTIKLLGKEMKTMKYIKDVKDIGKYYYHCVSHPIGIDVHDIFNNGPLKAGDVISCEPGLYVKEDEIGVRIEDDILITKTGSEVLSSEIIKEINDIENLF